MSFADKVVPWLRQWKGCTLQQNERQRKFCCRDKDFHKNSPVHMKRFDNMLRQLVTKLVDKDWSELAVTVTCYCDLLPCVPTLNHMLSVFCFFFLAGGACACMSSRQAGARLKSRVESLYGVFPVPLGQFTSVTYPR